MGGQSDDMPLYIFQQIVLSKNVSFELMINKKST